MDSRLGAGGRTIILSGLALLFLSIVCCGLPERLAYEHDLVGEYAIWADDTLAEATVVEKDDAGAGVVVGPMVYATAGTTTLSSPSSIRTLVGSATSIRR